MENFTYKDGELYAEAVAVKDIADQYGTPCYVYSKAGIELNYRAYEQAVGTYPHLICYAVKANPNLAVLNILARMGAGFDIVSGGELQRVLAAGGNPEKVIFSGVGKTEEEIAQALQAGIHCFNVESASELDRINTIAARLGCRAPVSLRVNPDVDAGTHPYISTGLKENKLGIDSNEALGVYGHAANLSNIDVIGIDCHIGSQLTEITPFLDALERLLVLVDKLADADISLHHIDIGGGLGVTYQSETPPTPDALISAVLEKMSGRKLRLLLEPGRSIVANAGVLLVRVEYLKHTPHKNFAIVDGAMNDLLRPALYGAWQDIIPGIKSDQQSTVTYDVVGPVCETGDFLGKDRPLAVNPGDLLAVCSCGAYSFSMSSNYNSRNRAAEVMVDGDLSHLIRQRESIDDQLALEHLLPE
ncbi:MAG: diaminopimelate decarboxylase [Gammaproteobacteria bacterium]|nr:diaminopimelate decarboxylase [Gammaproteobacteria bacterium]